MSLGRKLYSEGKLTEQEISKEVQICARIFCRNKLVMYAVATKEGQSGFVRRKNLDELFERYNVEMSDKSSILRVNVEVTQLVKDEEIFIGMMFNRNTPVELKLTSENSDEARRLFNSGYVIINNSGVPEREIFKIISKKLSDMYDTKYEKAIANTILEQRVDHIKNGAYLAVTDRYITGTDEVVFYVGIDEKNSIKQLKADMGVHVIYTSHVVLTPEDIARLGLIPKVVATVNATDSTCAVKLFSMKRYDSTSENTKTFLVRIYDTVVNDKAVKFFATIDIANKKCIGTLDNGALTDNNSYVVKQLGFKTCVDVLVYIENKEINASVSKIILDDYEKYKNGEIKNSVFLYKDKKAVVGASGTTVTTVHMGEVLEAKANRQEQEADRQAKREEIEKARKIDTSRQSLMDMFKR